MSCKRAHPAHRPTGVGKHFWRRPLLAFERSFAIADATSPTEAGYVGEDVENILLKLIQADYDLEKAERVLSISMSLIK